MMPFDKKSRGPRTSEKQYEIYTKFLQNHQSFRFRKMTSENSEEINTLWEELTKKLNSCGSGAVKSTEQWKKTFTEWRSSIIRKARNNENLKQNEKVVLELTGEAVVTGIKTNELGFLNEKSKNEPDGKIKDSEWESDIQSDEEKNVEIIYIENEEEFSDLTSQEKTVEVDETEKEPTVRSPKLTRKKVYSTKSKLSQQYEQSIEQNKIALNGIADALNNIAKAIETGCQKIAEALQNS